MCGAASGHCEFCQHPDELLPVGRGSIPKTRDKSEIKAKYILQPLNSRSRLIGENLDKIWPRLVTCRFQGILIKLLDTVRDPGVNLGACQGAVDTRSGFGGVATKETYDFTVQQCWFMKLGGCVPCLSRTRMLPPARYKVWAALRPETMREIGNQPYSMTQL